MYNYVLDSNTIVQNYANLGSTVFGLNDMRRSNTSLQVYPNPANTYANLNLSEFRQGEKVQVSMINPAGSTVYSREILIGSSSTLRLETASWPEGIYLIRAGSASKTASSKVAIFR